MKRPQWITVGLAVVLTAGLYAFGSRVPGKKAAAPARAATSSPSEFTIDSIMLMVKQRLNPEQSSRISGLENSIARGAVNDQRLHLYHQLARFWGDSMGIFSPYAWYEAEAARLENSEKSLTFAAHLFLNNLQESHDQDARMMKWKALQAKDLFERSLIINPGNDSSKVGLGACYLFGNLSASPMEGIGKILEVAQRDSTHVYAQMMLAKGALISGQLDKAVNRLMIVNRHQPDNVEALLLLADINEGTGNKRAAAAWYRKSLAYISRADMRGEIEKRIADLDR